MVYDHQRLCLGVFRSIGAILPVHGKGERCYINYGGDHHLV